MKTARQELASSAISTRHQRDPSHIGERLNHR